MGKIKGWEKKPRNRNGDQWYRNTTDNGFMLGINKVAGGVRKGEYVVYVLNTFNPSGSLSLGYYNTFKQAQDNAVVYMRRNPIVRRI